MDAHSQSLTHSYGANDRVGVLVDSRLVSGNAPCHQLIPSEWKAHRGSELLISHGTSLGTSHQARRSVFDPNGSSRE